MKVEGKNAVVELFRSNTQIDKILIENSAQKSLGEIIGFAQKKHIRLQFLPKEAMDRESSAKNHQGVIAFVNGFKYADVDEMIDFANAQNQPPFLLLCDGIADPHNLGSIIRSAECAGVHGIIIPKNRACQVNDTVIKVSTGACFNVKIACVTNLNDAIRKLKEKGIWVFGLEANGTPIYQTDLTMPLALVVGSEGFGVSHLAQKLCDGILRFPMYGKVNSLNASVASGLAVYEVVRQRCLKKI